MQITNKQLKRLILEETKRALKESPLGPDIEPEDTLPDEQEGPDDSNLEARVATLEKSAAAALKIMTKLHKNQQTLKDLYKGLKS